MTSNMQRLEQIIADLPEAIRVDIEEWDGEPTFRVKGKNFVFTDQDATGICVKLPKNESAALVATDPAIQPAGYGLGRHGWVEIAFDDTVDEARWTEITEWIHTSYTLIAPRRLARLVDDTTTR